jgi:hypothetical protein
MLSQDLLDPDKGYVKDDSITLEVYVKADAPHGVRYDIAALLFLRSSNKQFLSQA